MRFAVVMSIVALTSGCADFWELNSQSPKVEVPPYNAAEYQPYQQPGTGSISGQAFLLNKSGEPKKAAGKDVTLDPATTMARAWWNSARAWTRMEPRLPEDSRFAAARKTTTADADGKFSFDGLPAGDYLIRTTVKWEPERCAEYGSSCSTQEGVIGGLVHLSAGEKKSVIFGKDATALPDGAKK